MLEGYSWSVDAGRLRGPGSQEDLQQEECALLSFLVWVVVWYLVGLAPASVHATVLDHKFGRAKDLPHHYRLPTNILLTTRYARVFFLVNNFINYLILCLTASSFSAGCYMTWHA